MNGDFKYEKITDNHIVCNLDIVHNRMRIQFWAWGIKKENEKLKAQLESSEKKDTPKPTQNSTPSPTENQSADNNSTYELTAGDYEIPGDIPAGKYDIIAISGDGEFILDGNDNFIDERMSSNAEENSDAIKERKNASLKDGNSITINYNLKVQLVPKN